MKTIFLPLMLAAIFSSLSAQPNMQDVVYLKNGSIIKGKIVSPENMATERVSAEGVKVQIAGGSVFVFPHDEIDSIKKESSLKEQIKHIKKDYFRREHGYRNITSFGVLYGANLKKVTPDPNDPNSYNNDDDWGMTLHTVNGYQWWPYLFTGAGMGIDRYINYKQTFSPFYFRVASEFLKKKVTPYVFGDVGYAVMWKQRNNVSYSYKSKGGLYVSAGAGIRIYTRSRASVILSASYKRTNSETTWWYTNYDTIIYNIKRTYQRLSLEVGVTF
jgi:hypothetical protein